MHISSLIFVVSIYIINSHYFAVILQFIFIYSVYSWSIYVLSVSFLCWLLPCFFFLRYYCYYFFAFYLSSYNYHFFSSVLTLSLPFPRSDLFSILPYAFINYYLVSFLCAIYVPFPWLHTPIYRFYSPPLFTTTHSQASK